jgi:hypothetical protein
MLILYILLRIGGLFISVFISSARIYLMRQTIRIGARVLLVLLLVFLIGSLGLRSGVTNAQVAETLPGDDIIPHSWGVIDRAGVLPTSAATAWPWVEQLGKDRAGWYAPQWIERSLNLYSASSTNPRYEQLKVGDVIPDWGGGSLKVLAIDAGHSVVYGSLHAPADATSTATRTDYAFTWALVLEDSTASSTTFHLRLRMQQPAKVWQRYLPPAPLGLIDFIFDQVMFDGLTEQLQRSA